MNPSVTWKLVRGEVELIRPEGPILKVPYRLEETDKMPRLSISSRKSLQHRKLQ
jgi:hypothetical protein